MSLVHCRGLHRLLEEHQKGDLRAEDAGIIVRHIFELLEEQTVEPWSSAEVEDAASSVQQLLGWQGMEWLQVSLTYFTFASCPLQDLWSFGLEIKASCPCIPCQQIIHLRDHPIPTCHLRLKASMATCIPARCLSCCESSMSATIYPDLVNLFHELLHLHGRQATPAREGWSRLYVHLRRAQFEQRCTTQRMCFGHRQRQAPPVPQANRGSVLQP